MSTDATLIKSIYLNYVLRAQAPRGPDMTNSSVNQNASHSTADITKQTYQFQFTPQGSTLPLVKAITSLDSLNQPDLLDWMDQFQSIAHLCQWSEETAVITLKVIVNQSILPLIEKKRTLESCFAAILEKKFPENERFIYEQELRLLKQIKFRTIQDYENAIRNTFRNYCICSNLKLSEHQKREEEYFFNGLHPITKVEMAKLGHKTQPSVSKCIQDIEYSLLQNPNLGKTLDTNKIPHVVHERKNCSTCQRFLKNNHKYGHISGFLSTAQPFKDISSDIYGPIPTHRFEEGGENNKFYLLTITDRCTRWTEVYKIKCLSTTSILRGFSKWVKNNVIPKTVLTDQGRPYISIEFAAYLDKYQIKHILASSYNPTGNSISEKINQTITRVLQVCEKIPIKEFIARTNYVLQNQYNRTTGLTPYEFKFEISPFDPEKRPLTKTIRDAFNKMKIQAEKDNNKINLKRINYPYKINDQVYKKILRTKKTDPIWAGPYTLTGKSPDGNQVTLKTDKHEIKANIKQIRPF